MHKAFQMTVAAAIGIAALSPGAPARAGSSDISAGLVGFGIGAILGGMMGPPEVYFVPPPPDERLWRACLPTLEDSSTSLRSSAGAWTDAFEGGKERSANSRSCAKI